MRPSYRGHDNEKPWQQAFDNITVTRFIWHFSVTAISRVSQNYLHTNERNIMHCPLHTCNTVLDIIKRNKTNKTGKPRDGISHAVCKDETRLGALSAYNSCGETKTSNMPRFGSVSGRVNQDLLPMQCSPDGAQLPKNQFNQPSQCLATVY